MASEEIQYARYNTQYLYSKNSYMLKIIAFIKMQQLDKGRD